MPVSRGLALTLLVLVHLAWSLHLLAGRVLVLDLPPFTLSFLRWLLAAPLLYGWSRSKSQENEAAVLRRWPLGLVLSLTGTYGFTAVLYLSLAKVTAARSGLIYGFTPALLSLLSALLLKERPSPSNALGILLSLVGIVVIVGAPSPALAISVGDVYALLATLGWSLYTVLGRWAMKRYQLGPVQATFMASLYSLPLGLAGSALELALGASYVLRPRDWLLLAYASFIAAALAFAAWYIAVEAVGPNVAAPFSNLIPVFAPLLDMVLLGEPVAQNEAVGGALVVAGALLASLSPRLRPSSRPRLA